MTYYFSSRKILPFFSVSKIVCLEVVCHISTKKKKWSGILFHFDYSEIALFAQKNKNKIEDICWSVCLCSLYLIKTVVRSTPFLLNYINLRDIPSQRFPKRQKSLLKILSLQCKGQETIVKRLVGTLHVPFP